MANRNWSNGGKVYSMHVSPVLLTATIQIGATGAVSSFSGSTVSSVVRNSTGNYTITFLPNTNLPIIIHASSAMQSASGGLSGIGQVEIQNSPQTSMASSSAPSITIQLLNPAGAAADAASGSACQILVIGNNSSVKS